jgi:hypothetical protein
MELRHLLAARDDVDHRPTHTHTQPTNSSVANVPVLEHLTFASMAVLLKYEYSLESIR